jgi:hypothetical protein
MHQTEPTPLAASSKQLLDAGLSAQTRQVVLAALGALGDKPDSLSARLEFGKLGRLVRRPEGESVRGSYQDEDIVARVAFVVGLSELIAASDLPDVLTTLYRTGSDREQISVLRALPYLADGERLVALAREASRTNDVTVFTALACDSAFPARFLPDSAFEQLVLKGLFMGVPIARIRDVESRVTAELQRMITDYANERRAAGRTVPGDVPWLLESPPTKARTT